MNNAAARLGGLIAIAALGFAFGGTFASDVESIAVVEAYRRARDVDCSSSCCRCRRDGNGLAGK